MTTTATDSPPTSELQFLDRNGNPHPLTEWMPGLLAVPIHPDDWQQASVAVNGRRAAVVLRSFGGRARAVVEWERAGPGWYDIEIRTGDTTETHRVRVEPSKISHAAYDHLLSDLEIRLPVTLAVALRDAGARIGGNLADPAKETVATELVRIRRALRGGDRMGLLASLDLIGRDPHRMLATNGRWTKRRDARRPDPTGLARALLHAHNMEANLPKNVFDLRVEHTTDLYENRILKAFTDEVSMRLRRLVAVLSESSKHDILREASTLLADLGAARRSATFLNEVGPLRHAPTSTTMVLMRRPEYRAMYEEFIAFRKRTSVALNEPAMMEPLKNLPYLYQVWGTLLVHSLVAETAAGSGYTVRSQRLVWPRAGGMYLSILRDNRASLEMQHPNGDVLRVYPERSYRTDGELLHSVSFTQRPDIAIELSRASGDVEVVLLDPKYKLENEQNPDSDGKPKKEDIDKMHAYRDAIRNENGLHVVRFAATLYPGTTEWFGQDVAAFRAYPDDQQALRMPIESLIRSWLNEHLQRPAATD